MRLTNKYFSQRILTYSKKDLPQFAVLTHNVYKPLGSLEVLRYFTVRWCNIQYSFCFNWSGCQGEFLRWDYGRQLEGEGGGWFSQFQTLLLHIANLSHTVPIVFRKEIAGWPGPAADKLCLGRPVFGRNCLVTQKAKFRVLWMFCESFTAIFLTDDVLLAS